MRAAIVSGLATALLAVLLAAGAAQSQPARQPTVTPTRHPPKCAYGERWVQVGACSAPRPWRCEPCQHGVRTLRIDDKCGAPVQFCLRARGQ